MAHLLMRTLQLPAAEHCKDLPRDTYVPRTLPADHPVQNKDALQHEHSRRPSLVWMFLVLACVMALPAFVTSTAARELRIRDFHVELVVMPDSSMDVVENIRVDFIGTWQGLYRTIPVEYRGPSGFNYSLFLEDISATNEAGTALRIERQRQNGNLKLKMYVPGAADATHTISLHYRVQNGLRFFEDHDELYWNITGNEWDVPIEAASAHIILPAGITGIHAANFTGVFGSRAQDAELEVLGSNVDVRAARPLAFHEGLTTVVGWDKGFVRPPAALEKISQFIRSNWPLLTPLVVGLCMFLLWFRSGRDPRVGPVAVQYEPPKDLSPAEMGTLVDNSADMRDITATIVDLAVRGYLTIEERATEHLMGLYSSKEYVFHMRKKTAEWAGAKPHELLLLSALFAGGSREQVTLTELQNKFYTSLPDIRSAIFDSLVSQHCYLRRPDKVRQTFTGGAVVAAMLLIWIGSAFAKMMGTQPVTFIVAAILTGAVILGFGWFMPARTESGTEALRNVLGFEDFLGHVEADRINRMTQGPDTFEKYLPFAMALGVEKKWAGAFEGIYMQPPSWYMGPPGSTFHAVGFGNSLGHMSASAAQAMSSAPRSSGSSGFGGGGSSGGGGGGGGGGGF